MGERGRRIRAILDAQFWLVVVLCLGLAAGGGYLTYKTYVEPGVAIEQRPGTSASYSGEFTHRATVQEPNPVYREGRTLVNREAYFTQLTPVLNGTFTFTYTASESGNLSADTTLELRLRSVGTRGERERTFEYWSVTRQLAESDVASLRPNEEIELSFSRNVSRLVARAQRIDEQVGGTPGTKQVSIVAVVNVEGQVNGHEVTRTQEYSLELVTDGNIYRAQDPGRVVNTTNTTRTVTVQKSYGSLRKGGAPLLLLLGVVGLAGLARARYRGILTLTEQEQEYLAYSRARDEFDDWITTVELGTSEFDADPIDVETLDGLVDIAIDSDRRVLQDAATGEYRCKVDDVIYRYVPPAEPDENQSTPDLFETTATRERESDEWEEEPTTDGAGTEASTDGSETESDDQ